MKRSLFKILLSVFTIFILTSFLIKNVDKSNSEISELELQILRKNMIGKTFEFDLTKNKNCNKTRIKYLGQIETKKGNRFKILNSFYVFKTTGDQCHGTNAIKMYNLKDKYVGAYYVNMPYDLPDSLNDNKLLFTKECKECESRKGKSIDFSEGLPESFFIECSNGNGDIFVFSE